ncbi:MAG TPA: ferric reductase-like transmembrane domain-containing protein [Solirubrobacteraceae bacterium]|jgi:sulfoxide reductase heme-binding subunit YedZ|nr:ferric reductase-like transmembrane domain-containing protein [Solirubrobacteraceae bacterium]
MRLAAIGSSSTAFWYLTRATGVVALVLLTLVMALGVADVTRLSSSYWPRFLTDAVHRRASVLALVFLAIHIVTSVLDTYAPIGLFDAVIPFHSSYRPVWLGLGAAAFDLLLAVIVTSLLRARIGGQAWRAVHWLAYACWPLAVLHGLGTGSDVEQTWMLTIDAICVVTVIGALALRLTATENVTTTGRLAAVGLPIAFLVGLAIWLPGGPLAAGWARRAGTPTKLIAGSSATVRGGR